MPSPEDNRPASSRGIRRLAAAILLGTIVIHANPALASLAYDTRFVGIDGDLASEITRNSLLQAQHKHPPQSLAALRDRARRDIDRLQTVLDSEGYYDATIDFAIDRRAQPAVVTVTIQPGQRYVFGTATVEPPKGAKPPALWNVTEPETLGLTVGKPARAATILSAEALILEQRRRHGWPFARIESRRVVADIATKTVTVTYILNLGPFCRFGPVTIRGLKRLDPAFARRRIVWKAGAVYDQDQVDKTKQALIATNLFAIVAVTPTKSLRPDGTTPMLITLTERARRSVTVGGGFDTSEGLEMTFGWENRNLFGDAQDVKTTATVGQSKNAAEIDYRRPDFGAVNQDFVASASLDNEILDAFRTISEQASAGIDWRLNPKLEFQASALAEHARINEITDTRTYTLVGLPLILKQDETDDTLNPTTGYRLDLTGTPYLRALGSQLTFTQMTATGTSYRKLDPDAEYVIAAQTALGASVGTSLASIPKDHRLYAGGGGSVRGFAYQKAGPLDSGENAIGGRSLFETSVELRIRLNESFGLVPFVDAGSDYASAFPDFSSLYEGVGIGLRYFTTIGPIRFDMATPLDPHSSDSPIQVYIGLGQAF